MSGQDRDRSAPARIGEDCTTLAVVILTLTMIVVMLTVTMLSMLILSRQRALVALAGYDEESPNSWLLHTSSY